MSAIRAQSYAEDRASGASVFDGCVYFNGDKNQYLTRTPSSDGNRRTWTYSAWFKRGKGTWGTTDEMHLLDATTSGTKNFYGLYIGGNNDGDKLSYWETHDSGGTTYYWAKQLSAQRDFQGWYHVVFNYDTTQSSSSERIRFFINGVNYGLEPENGTYPWPAQNYIGAVNSATTPHYMGSYNGSRSFDGLISNINFIDGQRLDASYFGFTDPLTGTWRPKKYDGATTTSFMWPLASTIVDTFNTVSFTENGGSTSFTSAGTNSFGLSNCADYADDGKYLSYAIYPAKKWTIDFYVKFDDVTSGLNSYIAGWNGTGGGNCCFGLTKSSSTFTVWGDTNLSSSTVASTGTWYQVRMASAGSTNLKLYVNGTLIATDSGNDQDPATPLTFGDIQSGRFNGQLAGIRYVPDDLGAPTAGGEVSTGGLLPNVKTIGVNYGINGFHLPLDGNRPLGEDQSGKGNNWTTKNLPPSVAIDKATGAFPVYNTQSGGYVIASPEIRGQAGVAVTVYNSGSGDKFYLDGVEAGTVNFARGQVVTFDTSDSTVATHPFRLSGVSDGGHADYYSVDFDGTGDYLSIAESTDWLLEEGDFTIEFWAYFDNISTNGGIVTNMDNFDDSAQYNSRFVVGLYSSELRVWLADDGAHVLHDFLPPQGEWVHYAVTRETGNKFTLYRNGANIFTATQTCDLDTNGALQVGYLNNLGTYDGKIADLRLVKGTAVYTTDFHPPITSLTNITNTKVLCCNSSTVTGYTVSPGTITANGDPAASNDNAYDTYPFATVTGISEGTVGAATTIVFPHNVPENLYYYCTNHSGMGGAVGLTTDIQAADLHASKCILAVPLYASENLANWEDLSNRMNPLSVEKTITDNSAISRGTYQDYWNFYRRACYFDASSDYVSIASGYADLKLGSNPFTIEGWVYTGTDGTINQTIINSKRYYQSGYNGNWLIRRSSATQIAFASYNGQSDEEYTTFTCDFPKDEWHHFAFVRNNNGTNGCTMYVDGMDCGNMTVTKALDDGNASGIFIGTEHNSGPGNAKWDGFMQDIRIYNGVAKYTSEFIPASPKPSMLPSSPAGASYGSQLEKPTSGAVSLNPAGDSGDYLSIATSSDFEFGTGDYTIEFWFYRIATGQGNIYEARDGGNTNRILFYVNSANQLSTYINASQNNGAVTYTDRWYHAALSRSSGTNRMFLDGVLQTSWADTVDVDQPSSTFWIGKDYTGSNDFQGFLSNFRVVKGTALYTAGFTPSTKPLTTTSQGATASEVKLLCCQSSLAGNTASVTPSALGPSNQSYKDSTTASQNWDSSSASSSTSAALGPDDIYWVDLGQSTKVYKITFDVACSASANLSLTNFIIYYSTSSSSTGSSICYSGCTQTVTNTYTGSAPGTVSVTYEALIPVSAQYIGVTNGSGSYSGTLTYSNLVVTARPLASEFNPFDTNIDYVSSEPSEYATLNTLYKNSNVSVTDGNLAMTISSSGHYSTIATLGMTTGKYYWEVGAGKGWTNDPAWGIVGEEAEHYDDQTNSVPGAWVRNNGRRYYEGTEGDVWMTASQMNVNSGNTLGLAYDGFLGTLQVFINGIDQGIAFTGLKKGMTRNLGSGTSNRWFPAFKMYDGGPINVNFGQKPFKFAPPKGFLSLCTANIPRPGVARPTNYVGLSSYVGNGSSNSVSDLNFKPDLIWVKDANDGDNWITVNSVTGIGNMTKLNEPEKEFSETGDFTSFDDKGFSFGLYNNINQSSITYTTYCWKAGGNKNTFNVDDVGYATAAAAGLDGGSIDPIAASVGTQQGLSIIKYTGTGSAGTIAHGLSQKPSFMTFRNLPNPAGSLNWPVYHQSKGATGYLRLDQNNAWGAKTSVFNDTEPTSSVLTIGSDSDINISGEAYMGWIWHDVEGLQKFGIYTGNGQSGNGAYVELGFKPALLICKNLSTSNWVVWDNVRSTYNLRNNYYYINGPDASTNDGTSGVDFLANGFKMYNSYTDANADNNEYVYMAWAETPFRNMYGATGPGG